MKRLNFIDVARSYAIFLALFSHAMITFGGFSALGEDAFPVRLFTRTATPLFVFMFGMMLELVYTSKARQQGLSSIIRRLVLRSAQCYLGYQLTIVAGIFGHHLTTAEGARALVFMGDAHFSNILRLYTVAMLLAIPVIWLRCRLGSWFLPLMLAIVWAGDIGLESYHGASLGRLDPLMGVFLGIGSHPSGPSIWHGMTFVFAGMMVASSLRNWKELGLRRFYYTSSLLAAFSALVITKLAMDSSLISVASQFADFTYRVNNDIGYYAGGLLACAITLLLLSRIIPLYTTLPRWTRVPLSFSRCSLLSYSLGNIMLNLIPLGMASESTSSAVISSILFVLFMMLLVSSRYIEVGYQKASTIGFDLKSKVA